MERFVAAVWEMDTVLVGTWMGSEVVASFAAGLGVPASEMETLDSQTEGHLGIAVHRNLISTARERSSSQHDS